MGVCGLAPVDVGAGDGGGVIAGGFLPAPDVPHPVAEAGEGVPDVEGERVEDSPVSAPRNKRRH